VASITTPQRNRHSNSVRIFSAPYLASAHGLMSSTPARTEVGKAKTLVPYFPETSFWFIIPEMMGTLKISQLGRELWSKIVAAHGEINSRNRYLEIVQGENGGGRVLWRFTKVASPEDAPSSYVNWGTVWLTGLISDEIKKRISRGGGGHY